MKFENAVRREEVREGKDRFARQLFQSPGEMARTNSSSAPQANVATNSVQQPDNAAGGTTTGDTGIRDPSVPAVDINRQRDTGNLLDASRKSGMRSSSAGSIRHPSIRHTGAEARRLPPLASRVIPVRRLTRRQDTLVCGKLRGAQRVLSRALTPCAPCARESSVSGRRSLRFGRQMESSARNRRACLKELERAVTVQSQTA